MKTWTDQAERRLLEYLDARVRREGLDGLDAIELKEDLRSHVHEELEQASGERIGMAELEQVLDRLGRGAEPATAVDGRGRGWLFTGGVVLPGLVAVFEILTGFCGGVFFDPVPTVFHSLLVLAVPALNAWLLFAGRRADSRWQGLAAGMALVIAVFYAVLFLPLVPASLFALLVVGMGLLSLTPVLAGVVTWRISKRSRAAAARPWRFRSGWRIGAVAAVVALLALEGPAGWTRIQLARAVSDDPEEAAAGLSALRGFHSQRTLLRACYEGNRGTSLATDIPGWIENGWKLPVSMFGRGTVIGELSAEPVRDVYFRVTGEPFNSVKPPRMASGGGRGNAWNDFEFDENLGGDSVAMRLKDLDLTESRFDGHIDGVSGLGYGEWTMVFRNRASQAKEARCLVRLPRGGRVSRLTLWVNGEPREAAFSSVEKVKAAYREVAVRQQRDPVLVTMAGPDTVLVQCFPVPARGEMKIRFGLTAAVVDGGWELPRIVERNFGLVEQGRHALWLQADRRFSAVGDLETPAPSPEGQGFSVNSVLPIDSVIGGPAVVRLDGGEDPSGPVWCEDPFATNQERYLIRQPRDGMRRPTDRLVVVIDGSASLAGHADWLRAMLEETGVETLIADDGVLRGEEIADYTFSGGRNNEPALSEAISLAREGESGAVVWIHGPQAAELTSAETLLQMLERGSRRPDIFEIELVSGPNRMVEALGKAETLERGPAMTDPITELPAFLQSLKSGGPEPGWEWQRTADVTAVEGTKVWDHLARQWAMERSESDDPARGRIAAAYQLVTPVSGAVVLETMEQFEAAGLTPVDAAAAPSLPAVPEPSTSVLVLIGGMLAMTRRRRAGPERG